MDKKTFISLVYHVLNTPIDTKTFSVRGTANLLVLITAAGQITGTLLQKKDESDLKESMIDTIYLTGVESFAKHTNEDSIILLKDAVLKTAGGSISYRYLYVFTDDIIAATFGNSDGQ